MTKPVRFLERDKETFDNMPKDNNAVYFVYDSEGNNVIYKGDVPYGGGGTAELPTYIGIGNTTVTTDTINNTVSISSPTLTAGSNITLSPDTVNNTITISADSGPDTGVGEWIPEGDTFIDAGVTYTVGKKVERFNCYANDTTLGVEINKAAGNYSHVEGASNKAYADYSHAEGKTTTASGSSAHAEGYNSTAEGDYTHAENSSYAKGDYAHSEGYSIKDTVTPANSTGALAEYSHTEGYNCKAQGIQGSHAEGYESKAVGACTHAEGYQTQAIGNYSHTEGYNNLCVADRGHVEGQGNQIVTGACKYSHAEGINNIISDAETAHAEGDNNKIIVGSNRAHVEGFNNTITGDIAVQNSGSWEAHAEGRDNRIEHSYRAHIEGQNNAIYKSNSAHAEGYGNVINKDSTASHAEGYNNIIGDNLGNNAVAAHVQGDSNTATGDQSSATGYHTTASGINSTTMGYYTQASGSQAVAIGSHTNATGANQLAMGDYNVPNNSVTPLRTDSNGNTYILNKFPLIIGNGYHGNTTDTDITSDAFKVDCDGKIYVRDTDGVDVSGLNVTSNDNNKVLTASYSGGVGTYSWQDAPDNGACIVHTYTNTSLPNKVVLDNNNEYRYINLTGATGITISIETVDMTKSFYSSIVLHNINSTDTLSNFVNVSVDSVVSNVIFLNENNVDLSTADTIEMLFFINGMANSVMCIAYAYETATP